MRLRTLSSCELTAIEATTPSRWAIEANFRRCSCVTSGTSVASGGRCRRVADTIRLKSVLSTSERVRDMSEVRRETIVSAASVPIAAGRPSPMSGPGRSGRSRGAAK